MASSAKRTPSPTFRFYPRDFLLSRKVNRMSLTERGAYITLLAMCWIDGGIGPDLGQIARDLGQKPAKFRTMWERGVLHECFVEKHGKLVSPRLEEERRKQNEYRDKQANAASMRWHKEAPSEGNAFVSDRIVSDRIVSEKEECAEPLHDSSPIVCTFKTVGNPPTWDLHRSRIDGWLPAYPNIDVEGECRKAWAWVDANPQKRKTARGMPAFLVRWLGNAVDRPGAGAGTTGSLKTAGNLAALQAFANRGRTA